MAAIPNRFNHHHPHALRADMLFSKAHKLATHPLALMAWRDGDDVDFAHLVFGVDAQSNEAGEVLAQ